MRVGSNNYNKRTEKDCHRMLHELLNSRYLWTSLHAVIIRVTLGGGGLSH
jgi:hypothetical protein